MGAEGFHCRVRDGIGCWDLRYGHQVVRKTEEQTSVNLLPLRAGRDLPPCGVGSCIQGVF